MARTIRSENDVCLDVLGGPMLEDGSSGPPSNEHVSSPQHHRKHVLWKWSIGLSVFVVFLMIWQCSSVFHQGKDATDRAVADFHKKLNAGLYEEIYRDADAGLAGEARHAELLKFLEGVHKKLGDAGVSSQDNMRVNATTFGSSIVAQYSTKFTRGPAVETFTWVKKDTGLRLHGYDVRADAFLTN